jgi:hypothetical protein
MKLKIKLWSLVFPIFFFLSCTKEKMNNNTNVSASKIQEVVNASSLASVKIQYSLLTPVEKQSLWVSHLTEAINNNGYSQTQCAKILELRDFLTSLNIFESSNSAYAAYVNQILIPGWLTSVQVLFSEAEQAYLLQSTFSSYIDYTNSVGAVVNGGGGGGGGGGGAGEQNCWCIPSAGRYSWDCPVITLGSTTIGWESCPLNNVACNSQGGCGWLWFQTCSGLCAGQL